MFEEYHADITTFLHELAAAYLGEDYPYRLFRNDALKYVLLEIHLPDPFNPFGDAPVRIIVNFCGDELAVSVGSISDIRRVEKFSVASLDEFAYALQSWMPHIRSDLDTLLTEWQADADYR